MQSLVDYLNEIIESAVRRGDTRAASIYRTFKAEVFHKYGKEPTWDNATEYAYNVKSKMDENKALAASKGVEYTPPQDEVEFLLDFLPKQMEYEDIKEYFRNKIAEGEANKGKLMKAIKSEHKFGYSGKQAAVILGDLLSNAEAK